MKFVTAVCYQFIRYVQSASHKSSWKTPCKTGLSVAHTAR